jgi:chromosomal replication initiation ATPase DnaA
MKQLELIKPNKPLMPYLSKYRAMIKRQPNEHEILTIVALITNVEVSEIKGEKRKEGIADARRIACYFIYLYTPMSYTAIMRYMDYENHTSVLHAVKSINDQIEVNDIKIRPLAQSIWGILNNLYTLKIVEKQTNKKIVPQIHILNN